jgi:hypothetical protein
MSQITASDTILPSGGPDRRSVLAGTVALAVAASLGAVPAGAAAPAIAAPPDFDFLVGTWHVSHRQLKRRLAGETEWISFDGSSTLHKILGGLGNIDENEVRKPAGTYIGVTLRLYDPAKRSWSIYWMDSRTPSGDIGIALVGSFENGIGTFFSDETFEGKPIKVRYIWNATNPDRPHWQQAFSPDAGKTWEVNWVCEFTRAA